MRIFDYPAVFAKNGSYGYGAKSRWGPPRVHLGANGVPLGPKNGSKMLEITMPQNWNFRLPRGHCFSQKLEVTVMAPNHGGDPLGSILGSVGSHWVKKWVKTVKNYHAPKCEFFDYPAVIDFSKKMEVTVMAPSHSWDTIESILGPMGSHLVQKMGQDRKKLPYPKIRIFDYPSVIEFFPKMEVMVMAPNHGGDIIESILGPMGSH